MQLQALSLLSASFVCKGYLLLQSLRGVDHESLVKGKDLEAFVLLVLL